MDTNDQVVDDAECPAGDESTETQDCGLPACPSKQYKFCFPVKDPWLFTNL